jgi:hypothetical protein
MSISSFLYDTIWGVTSNSNPTPTPTTTTDSPQTGVQIPCTSIITTATNYEVAPSNHVGLQNDITPPMKQISEPEVKEAAPQTNQLLAEAATQPAQTAQPRAAFLLAELMIGSENDFIGFESAAKVDVRAETLATLLPYQPDEAASFDAAAESSSLAFLPHPPLVREQYYTSDSASQTSAADTKEPASYHIGKIRQAVNTLEDLYDPHRIAAAPATASDSDSESDPASLAEQAISFRFEVQNEQLRAKIAEIEASNVQLRAKLTELEAANRRHGRAVAHKDVMYQQLKQKYERHASKLENVHSQLDSAVQTIDSQARNHKINARHQNKKHRLEKQTIRSRTKTKRNLSKEAE